MVPVGLETEVVLRLVLALPEGAELNKGAPNKWTITTTSEWTFFLPFLSF